MAWLCVVALALAVVAVVTAGAAVLLVGRIAADVTAALTRAALVKASQR